MSSVLPTECDWIKDRAVAFDPENNSLTVSSGKQVRTHHQMLKKDRGDHEVERGVKDGVGGVECVCVCMYVHVCLCVCVCVCVCVCINWFVSELTAICLNSGI